MTETARPLRILMAVVTRSPFSRSIWTGLLQGFQQLGHEVAITEDSALPAVDSPGVNPDLLISVHGAHTPVGMVSRYRDAGIPAVVYLLDEPYEVDRSIGWSRFYDVAFSVDRVTVGLHEQHTKACFLPLAYNRSVFSSNGPAIRSTILVLGSPFAAREQYLAALRDSYGRQVTWVGPGWKKFSPAGIHYEQYVGPQDCARFYRGADIVINIHRDSRWSHFGELNSRGLQATHLNPRFWEAAACNSAQLCSYRSDLEKFAPDCPSFSNIEQFEKELERLVTSGKARKEAATKTRKCIAGHDYLARCRTLLKEAGLAPEHSDNS